MLLSRAGGGAMDVADKRSSGNEYLHTIHSLREDILAVEWTGVAGGPFRPPRPSLSNGCSILVNDASTEAHGVTEAPAASGPAL